MNVLELRESDGVFDFVVDGVSLRSLLRTDNTSTLRRWDRPEGFARELVDGDGSLEGRVPIYACRECRVKLDTWDGGHAVRIGRSDGRIIWHEIEEFGNSVGDDGEQLDFTPTGIGPFEFDPAQYRAPLEPLMT
ncbi:MAG TPA: hypothetical protein VIG46_09655 [Candidatus Baltobacteraceae bacterium]